MREILQGTPEPHLPSATNVPRANFQVQEKENRGRAAGYAEFNFLLTAHLKDQKFENKTIIKSRIMMQDNLGFPT